MLQKSQTKQYTAVKENLKQYLALCKRDEEKGKENLYRLFNTDDRYEAASVVFMAIQNFPLKWQQRILNLWNEVQLYFKETPKPGMKVIPLVKGGSWSSDASENSDANAHSDEADWWDIASDTHGSDAYDPAEDAVYMPMGEEREEWNENPLD